VKAFHFLRGWRHRQGPAGLEASVGSHTICRRTHTQKARSPSHSAPSGSSPQRNSSQSTSLIGCRAHGPVTDAMVKYA